MILSDHVFLILVSQVSHLLAPTLDQPPEFGPSTVPCDRQDMFTRLATLLSFEVAPLNDTVSDDSIYRYELHVQGGASYVLFEWRKTCEMYDRINSKYDSTTLVTAIKYSRCGVGE